MTQHSNSQSEDDLDELMAEFASEDAIRSAKREKEEGEEIEKVGVLVKGFPDPQRELDLHGLSVPEALFEVSRFINQATQHRIRTVRIITGKGLHSKNMTSVLPGEVEKQLAALKRDRKVLAFRREKTGGSFAVYLIS